jgi:LPXTG-motif cell wall-anchored protein
MTSWTQESLRAFAGFILLILALANIFTGNETTTVNYTILSLVGFLAGGALLQQKKENE